MGRLYLLRHARAAWADPGTRDFDRRLTEAGRQETEAVGAFMSSREYQPDMVICSPAARAIETWEGVARSLDRKRSDAILSEALYSSDATGYLSLVRNNGVAGSIMIVGHNPMIEDLAIVLSSGKQSELHTAFTAGFPTAGLAVLAFEQPLSSAAPGAGRLEAFLNPATG